MEKKYCRAILLFFVVTLLVGCATPKGATVEDKRNYVLKMKDETLARLYAQESDAKRMIKHAAGYATFSNINTNLFLVSTARGYGVVVDNATGGKTYMKMAQLGVGPGLGIKDFRAVLIFKNKEVMKEFVEKGWEFGGHADAAAKSGEKGDAIGAEAYIDNDIVIYTITEAGAALQATIAGTKYWRSDELNHS
jgi:lipid-binding SYLF domain-containing protein